MKFDSNLAWKQAAASVSANREVLLAMAGVFFVLPALALDLFLPQPIVSQNLGNEVARAAAEARYLGILPYAIPTALIQAAGTLGMLTLFTDRSRPTVGQAIRRGVTGIVPYLLAQILMGLGVGLGGGLLIVIGVFSGSVAFRTVCVAAATLLVLYAIIRTSLAAPVIAVEGERNPVAALVRSWNLTTGNVLRIMLFYLLIVLAFIVVMAAVMAVAGALLAFAMGPEGQKIVISLISALLGAGMTVYVVAIVAAIHRQLAGPSPETVSAPFE